MKGERFTSFHSSIVAGGAGPAVATIYRVPVGCEIDWVSFHITADIIDAGVPASGSAITWLSLNQTATLGVPAAFTGVADNSIVALGRLAWNLIAAGDIPLAMVNYFAGPGLGVRLPRQSFVYVFPFSTSGATTSTHQTIIGFRKTE